MIVQSHDHLDALLGYAGHFLLADQRTVVKRLSRSPSKGPLSLVPNPLLAAEVTASGLGNWLKLTTVGLDLLSICDSGSVHVGGQKIGPICAAPVLTKVVQIEPRLMKPGSMSNPEQLELCQKFESKLNFVFVCFLCR